MLLTDRVNTIGLLRPLGATPAGGKGSDGVGEVTQRPPTAALQLSDVELHALRCTPQLPKKLADKNLRLLKSGHPDQMRFGNLAEFKEFLVDQTDMVRGWAAGTGSKQWALPAGAGSRHATAT